MLFVSATAQNHGLTKEDMRQFKEEVLRELKHPTMQDLPAGHDLSKKSAGEEGEFGDAPQWNWSKDFGGSGWDKAEEMPVEQIRIPGDLPPSMPTTTFTLPENFILRTFPLENIQPP